DVADADPYADEELRREDRLLRRTEVDEAGKRQHRGHDQWAENGGAEEPDPLASLPADDRGERHEGELRERYLRGRLADRVGEGRSESLNEDDRRQRHDDEHSGGMDERQGARVAPSFLA